MEKNKLTLSTLNKTWIFDIDGTLVKHNGYKLDGFDTLLPGVKDFFFKNVREKDYVLLLTSRKMEYKGLTESFLTNNGIRFDEIIYELPLGERILFNDKKESGLEMAYSISTDRNDSMDLLIEFDEKK